MDLSSGKKELLALCRQMTEKGYALGTSGNISIRADGDICVITPSGMAYEKLNEDDFVASDLQGNIVEGRHKPSIELSMHRRIYMDRDDVFAVFHNHSTYSTIAASLLGVDELPPVDIESVIYLGGSIKVAPFALPGSEELAEFAVQALGMRGGVLLQNHGAIGVGKTLGEARTASDILERLCQMYLQINAVGKLNPLTGEAVDKYAKLYLSRRKS